ncbi:hypothetical protein CFIMG_005023RA [Ceratocystis fimbriata CBS 114723]|uniref:Uncharacterized protein n=1 Tax=Ceratocystis fimbriata CBS 114723 TaxID=1035309 RepID=A0A2C5WZH7_9PEZI|nr:hypothetical protein CFIMG_005023RA [Ceratocystis fimbriata CBS 114723]
MVSLRAFVTCAMALGATAAPLNIARDTPTTWTIQVFPDTPAEVFHGEITEVWKEVLAENPHFEEDFPNFKKNLIAMGYLTADELKKRLAPSSTRSTTSSKEDVQDWSIQVFKGGDVEKFEGDIVDVYTEVLETNPKFEDDFPSYKKLLVTMGWMTEQEVEEAETAAGLK